MYEIQLEEGEIINYNQPAKIEIDGYIRNVGLVITNFYLMIFEDENKKIEFKEILRLVKGTSSVPNYKLVLKERLSALKCFYQDGNTFIQIADKTIQVIGQQLPLPIYK